MQSTTSYDHHVKLLMLGDFGVGKTCLFHRYTDDRISRPLFMHASIGNEFRIKMAVLRGKKVKLQIWDTAGMERFRNISPGYFRGGMGILLVYDVSDENSFRNVTDWMRQIELKAPPEVNTALVGNKCDVAEEDRVVSFEQGEELAASHGIRFLETSAREDVNVAQAFEGLATDVIQRLQCQDQAARGAAPALTLNKEESTEKIAVCC